MIRRTVSFEDLHNHSTEPTAPIYRNPERDQMSDDQSLLDHLSLDNTMKFNRSIPQTETNNQRTPTSTPREITATLINNEEDVMKFGSPKCNIPINDWIFRFEYKNNIKNFPEGIKRNKLINMLSGDAESYVFRCLKDDPNLSYEEIKKLLIEGFTSQFEPTVCFYKLVDNNWKKGDSLWSYWNEKLSLMEKCDPNFTFTTKKNLLIMGLPRALRQMVNAQILLNDPKCLNSLYQIIEAMYTIMCDGEQKAKQNVNNPKPFSKVEKSNDNFQKNKNQYQQGNRGFQRPVQQNRPNFNKNSGNNYNRNPNQYRNQNNYSNNNASNANNSNNQNDRNKNNNRGNNQQFKSNFKWSEDGRPICGQCSEVGHMKRECPQNNQEN